MANGTDTQDEEQGQDFRAPLAPPVAATPSAAPRVTPPPFVRAPGYDPAATGMEQYQRGMMMAGVPIANAERAVKAAQLFQAQRGYQRDIAGGMSAVEAGAKWGPSLFGATAGSASALARMATAQQPSRKIVRGPGGQLFEDTGTGALTPLTGAPVPNPETAVKKNLANQGAIKRLEGVTPENVFTAPFTPEGDVLRQANFDRLKAMRPPSVPPPAGPPPQSAPTAAAPTVAAAPRAVPQTVIRMTKDGRRAVFDASTKQFLQYAQ